MIIHIDGLGSISSVLIHQGIFAQHTVIVALFCCTVVSFWSLLAIRAHGHPLGHVQVQFSDRRDRLITRGPEGPWGRWEGIAFQTCGSETPRGPEGLIQEKMRSSFNSWWFNSLEMISVRERIMRTNSDNGFHSALPTLSAHMERSDEERIAESRNEPLKIDSEPPSAWPAEAQT